MALATTAGTVQPQQKAERAAGVEEGKNKWQGDGGTGSVERRGLKTGEIGEKALLKGCFWEIPEQYTVFSLFRLLLNCSAVKIKFSILPKDHKMAAYCTITSSGFFVVREESFVCSQSLSFSRGFSRA